MLTAKHENLWSLDLGIREPYGEFSPQEQVLIDFRLGLPTQDKSKLGMQYGLTGIAPDMVFSPFKENIAQQHEADRMEAIKLELKRMRQT